VFFLPSAVSLCHQFLFHLTKMYYECEGARTRIAHHIRMEAALTSPGRKHAEETAMNGREIFIAVLITTAALGVLGTTFTAMAGSDRYSGPRGYVMPCSLDGVLPAVHPDIFGNAAVAREYGFIRSRDGTWHVKDNCVRGLTVP
jgi:hypothetical protein